MGQIKFRAWDKKYEFGSDGSVWSLDFNHTGKRKQLKTYLDQDGYPTVVFNHDGIRSVVRVHRAVGILFLGPKPTPKHQVNHKNGIKADNRIENLEWVTCQENVVHGWRQIGRKISDSVRRNGAALFSGTRNPKAKINLETAKEIKRLRIECGYSLKSIADDFGISTAQVSAIASGRCWK